MLGDASVTNLEEMPRRQRLDPLEKRARRARAEEREEVVDAPRIGPRRDQPRGQQRLDLRAPEQPAVGLGVIKRADPDPVAAQDQCARVAVPERDGELAAGLRKHPLAMVFVEMDPGLGVAAGRQRGARAQEAAGAARDTRRARR